MPLVRAEGLEERSGSVADPAAQVLWTGVKDTSFPVEAFLCGTLSKASLEEQGVNDRWMGPSRSRLKFLTSLPACLRLPVLQRFLNKENRSTPQF